MMDVLEKIGWTALYYANTLALFTVLAVCARGMSAIRWPKNVIKSATANMCMLAVNMTIAPVIYLLATLAQAGYDRLALPHVASEAWADVPGWVMVITAILIKDFADYWNHRLLHYGVFWPIHSIHHSDPDLNNTTAFRVHFLESLMMDLSYVFLASWAGLPPGVTAGVSLLLVLYNRYIHMTVDWEHGIFHHVFVSPRFHQWHHADDPSSYNTNFANIFVGWDLLFGTYRVPGPCRERFGIPGMPKHNIFKLMIWPFTEWVQMGQQALRFSSKRTQNASSAELAPWLTELTIHPLAPSRGGENGD